MSNFFCITCEPSTLYYCIHNYRQTPYGIDISAVLLATVNVECLCSDRRILTRSTLKCNVSVTCVVYKSGAVYSYFVVSI